MGTPCAHTAVSEDLLLFIIPHWKSEVIDKLRLVTLKNSKRAVSFRAISRMQPRNQKGEG